MTDADRWVAQPNCDCDACYRARWEDLKDRSHVMVKPDGVEILFVQGSKPIEKPKILVSPDAVIAAFKAKFGR